MISSKVEICNLALSRIGAKGTVENIDEPIKQTEIVCAKWYDLARKTALKQMMPSFARKREFWALDANGKPDFGYEYAYKYKNDCLKILGIGNLYEKRNNYAVEDGYLFINELYKDGLPVRYIKDITNVTKFTPDFIHLFAWFLARDICIELTDSSQKYAEIEQILPMKILEYCGVDAQENKPIRIARSNLMRARAGLYPMGRKA